MITLGAARTKVKSKHSSRLTAVVDALGAPPSPSANAEPPTGAWWTDPTGQHELRFCDRGTWTEHVRDASVLSVDPMPPEPDPHGAAHRLIVIADQ